MILDNTSQPMDIYQFLASQGLTSGVQQDDGSLSQFQLPDWMLSGGANNPDEVFGMPQGRPVLYDQSGRVLSDAETWALMAQAGNTGTGMGGNTDGRYGTAGSLFNPWGAGQNQFQYGQTPAGYQIGSPDAEQGNLGWYGNGLTPTYDPTYGWVVPNSPDIMKRQYDNYGNMVSNNQGNDFEAFMTELPRILAISGVTAGVGSALGAAGGVAAGTGETAGGLSGASTMPESYWSMLAGDSSAAAGTVATTTGGAAAGGAAGGVVANGFIAQQLVNAGLTVAQANMAAGLIQAGSTLSAAVSAVSGNGGGSGFNTGANSLGTALGDAYGGYQAPLETYGNPTISSGGGTDLGSYGIPNPTFDSGQNSLGVALAGNGANWYDGLLNTGGNFLKSLLSGNGSGSSGGGSSWLNNLAAVAPSLAAINYAKNQDPFDTSKLNNIFSQFQPEARAYQYDVNTGLGRNQLTSSLARRGVSGSSFGDQSLTNFNTSRDLGRRSLLDSGLTAQAGVAGQIVDADVKSRASKNELYGRALLALSGGLSPRLSGVVKP